jgi:hypothetical protein
MIPNKQTEAQEREHGKAQGKGFKPITSTAMPSGKGTPASGPGAGAASATASPAELSKARKALPPQLVSSMLDDIAKIDPQQAQQTGTLGKVGHLTAHVVDPRTLGIHHGMTQPPDLTGGATNEHPGVGDIVPKGHLYIPHGTPPHQLPDHLLGRTVESHLMNRGWQHDSAKRISKHLQTPPAPPPMQQQGPPAGPQGMPGPLSGMMGGMMPGMGGGLGGQGGM